MKPPVDKKTYEGDIATYWFEDGILVSLSKSPRRTVANISANIELVKSITDNRRVPLLIYITNSPMPDRATRKFSAEQLPNVYSAMAMVSKSGLGIFIMNLLFKLNEPPIPMRNFTDEAEAREWLKQFM